ncbi:LytR/AlgR family response regulator transcription factor [Sinomicrobium soli]|uniref:LytR/AlgR family response regulator transcription factor n=1 Tax=Sinomicrobium sp. N-1-3-6 TaxID=2219864 RepID=UPI000DCDDCE4|nr:LytTR family DNA-binding domain-containing protein [Sinomicrobium sp. N-1-3-6]RAV30046.1 DNA-binding response regulator [Sinomicrobium sp. N-1-3-6]
MRVVIIEDEKPAARRLRRMVEKLGIDVECLLHGVEEAVDWFHRHPSPDLILLDIQLSDGLSFEIFESAEISCPVIFTTAYDEYALRAFKLNSIDYLLKPIDDEELAGAIAKYRERISFSQAGIDFEAIRNMLVNPLERSYKKRFTVKLGQRLKMIPVEEIECFYSENKGTYLYTAESRNYLLDTTLDALETALCPDTFFRINRKCIVHIKAIRDIIAYTNARLQIYLYNFDDFQVIVSRDRVKNFKEWLG